VHLANYREVFFSIRNQRGGFSDIIPYRIILTGSTLTLEKKEINRHLPQTPFSLCSSLSSLMLTIMHVVGLVTPNIGENCCWHIWFGWETLVKDKNTLRQLTAEEVNRLQLTTEENFGSELSRKTENFGS